MDKKYTNGRIISDSTDKISLAIKSGLKGVVAKSIWIPVLLRNNNVLENFDEIITKNFNLSEKLKYKENYNDLPYGKVDENTEKTFFSIKNIKNNKNISSKLIQDIQNNKTYEQNNFNKEFLITKNNQISKTDENISNIFNSLKSNNFKTENLLKNNIKRNENNVFKFSKTLNTVHQNKYENFDKNFNYENVSNFSKIFAPDFSQNLEQKSSKKTYSLNQHLPRVFKEKTSDINNSISDRFTYAPTINIYSNDIKHDFMSELNRHKDELMKMLSTIQKRKDIRHYD